MRTKAGKGLGSHPLCGTGERWDIVCPPNVRMVCKVYKVPVFRKGAKDAIFWFLGAQEEK